MSTVNDTDILLVNRGGVSYNTEIEDMASIQDDDLLLINRGGQSYKITGEDFKGSVGPPGEPLEATITIAPPTGVEVGTTLTSSVTATGGISPYNYAYQWKIYNGFTISNIDGATSSVYTVTGNDWGLQLFCSVTVTDHISTSVSVDSNYTNTIPEPPPGGIVKASTRFNSDNDAYMSRTFSQGDQTNWTLSCWAKRSTLRESGMLFCMYD